MADVITKVISSERAPMGANTLSAETYRIGSTRRDGKTVGVGLVRQGRDFLIAVSSYGPRAAEAGLQGLLAEMTRLQSEAGTLKASLTIEAIGATAQRERILDAFAKDKLSDMRKDAEHLKGKRVKVVEGEASVGDAKNIVAHLLEIIDESDDEVPAKVTTLSPVRDLPATGSEVTIVTIEDPVGYSDPPATEDAELPGEPAETHEAAQIIDPQVLLGQETVTEEGAYADEAPDAVESEEAPLETEQDEPVAAAIGDEAASLDAEVEADAEPVQEPEAETAAEPETASTEAPSVQPAETVSLPPVEETLSPEPTPAPAAAPSKPSLLQFLFCTRFPGILSWAVVALLGAMIVASLAG